MSEGFQAKNGKVYIKLAIIQGKNSKLNGWVLKTQAKTQGFGKTRNAVCRNSVEKKAIDKCPW